ncbi:glucan endo-1,3-beta-glucosidase-like [Tasmannia lanceolata]|uniref:glucan endo-1,3-beta-glucosidase-like n=1 Tax=Tasmannia lanceolata TaxID=3420 RepID=UPI004063C30C
MASLAHGSKAGFNSGIDGDISPTPINTLMDYQNNIYKMWLSKYESEDLEILANTQLKFNITVANSDLQIFATKPLAVHSWVQKKIFYFMPFIDFQYICVGNEALSTGDSDYVLPAMKNIYDAIHENPPTKNMMIKVSTIVGTSDLNDYKLKNPPSTQRFADRIIGNLVPILDFLSSHDTPLFANISPYSEYNKHPDYPSLPNYLFTAEKPFIIDGHYSYKYVFDAMVDGFFSANEELHVTEQKEKEKELHVGDVKLAVVAAGWPRKGLLTAGHPQGAGNDASVANALTYNSNLVKHVQIGTPRSQVPLETYFEPSIYYKTM